MRKFIITSSGYTGEVHIVYGADALLMIIDFSHAELNAEQVYWFKEHIPPMYFADTFAGHLHSSKLTIVEGSYELTFDMFWAKYDHKINKKRCEPLWVKMGKTKQVKAYHGLTAYLSYLAKRPWQTQANPETYLKEEYWETDWTKVR